MMDPKRGDHVRLRSGGPVMVIELVDGHLARCLWTGTDGHTRFIVLPSAALRECARNPN